MLCLTAGPTLADVLWTAHVLPTLRRSLPQIQLIWESPLPALRRWLACYPELDETIADAEELTPPPDAYLILHPLWHPDGLHPLHGVFAACRAWCAPPASMPERPYCPASALELPRLGDLPQDYACLDPDPGFGLLAEEAMLRGWQDLAAQIPLPVVQLGSRQSPHLAGLIDARGPDASEQARAIGHARLFIGADSDSSCLAGALGAPQIWVEFEESAWYWPRSAPPLCSAHRVKTLELAEVLTLGDLVRRRLAGESGTP